jgi:hypothetical protein
MVVALTVRYFHALKASGSWGGNSLSAFSLESDAVWAWAG